MSSKTNKYSQVDDFEHINRKIDIELESMKAHTRQLEERLEKLEQ